METTVKIEHEWTDGGVWIAEPAPSDEGRSLAHYAHDVLHVKDWCFFQTSGTEGARKWVGLTKEALMLSARAVNEHFGITAQDHWLLALTPYHVGGFGILARAHLSGSPVTRLTGKWHAQTFVDACTTHHATLASLVPTQIFDLVAANLHAPPSMRAVLVGGGALNAELETAALALGWQVHRTYAMTETGSSVALQPRPGTELEVLPIWQVSTDAENVLTISGPALAQGYAICENDRWRLEPIPATGLRTRDRVEIAEIKGKRCLRFLGRESGIVKILGELVSLGPIQDRIDALRLDLALPDEAIVCDVPDPRRENTLALVVTSMNDETALGLLLALNAKLRPLEQISLIKRVAEIPRTELGKVRLPALRALL